MMEGAEGEKYPALRSANRDMVPALVEVREEGHILLDNGMVEVLTEAHIHHGLEVVQEVHCRPQESDEMAEDPVEVRIHRGLEVAQEVHCKPQESDEMVEALAGVHIHRGLEVGQEVHGRLQESGVMAVDPEEGHIRLASCLRTASLYYQLVSRYGRC
jgi:hypothetical protein